MFLCANCLSIVWVFFSVFFSVCLDYSRTNEQILIKKIMLGPDRIKKLLKKDLDLILDTKKIMNFQRSPFNVFLMTLDFYLIFL